MLVEHDHGHHRPYGQIKLSGSYRGVGFTEGYDPATQLFEGRFSSYTTVAEVKFG
jgi:hypothetical protein